jgi:molybdate/tungstate transport system permease protein
MSPTVSRDRRWRTVAAVLGGALALYYLVPILSLVLARPPGAVVAELGSPRVVEAAATSLFGALVATAIATAFGLPLAYWLARTDSRLRVPVLAVVVLPLVLPPIVAGMVLLTVVGPSTPLGRAATSLGVPLTGSLAGVVLAQTFVASPFVVVTARSAIGDVDRQLEAAARTLGADRTGTLRRVTLPLAWPGILAGVVLAFARALGEFGATLTLSYYPRTLPVEIWVAFSTQGLDRAFPVAVVLLGVSLAALAAVFVLGRNPW